MIDAAKIYTLPECVSKVVEAAKGEGLEAINEGYFEEHGASIVLVIPSLDAPEYKPGGQIPESKVADIARASGRLYCTGPEVFDIVAFACENLGEVKAAFEAAGIAVDNGEIEFEETFSGMVEIDTNY